MSRRGWRCQYDRRGWRKLVPLRLLDWLQACRFRGASRLRRRLRLDVLDVEELVGAAIRTAVQPGTWYVDVGAHRGRHVWAALEVPGTFALAVEADAQLAADIQHEAAARGLSTRVALANVAATGDAAPNVPFFRNRVDPGYSGLRERHIPGVSAWCEPVTVSSATLDALLEACGRVSVVKVDVEGAELSVLQGGANRIQRDRPILLFECAVDGASYYGYDLRDVGRLLWAWGYELAAITGQRLDSDRQLRTAFYGRTCYEFCAAPTAVSEAVFSQLATRYREFVRN